MAEAQPMYLAPLRADARAIFAHAIASCRVDRLLRERLRVEGDTLVLVTADQPDAPPTSARYRLDGFDDILIVALGKAAVPMTTSLLALVPRRLRVHGVCVAPGLPAEQDARIVWYAGGHPLPNADSLAAARHALRLLARATAKTLVLFLISGGGSTLFDLPLDPGLTLADTIAFHRALVASGAPIAEINTLRKHYSAVKGGRLAAAAPLATRHALLVLDVPAHQIDALASGPTFPDVTTMEDCRRILARYGLLATFPPSVRRFFSDPNPHGAPRKTTEDAFRETRHTALLSSQDLLRSAAETAASLGYDVTVDNTCDDWPYEQAVAYLLDRARDLRQPKRPHCLLSGGEITVRLGPSPGTGGRNQQCALLAALRLQSDFPREAIVCLSAGSDGADGNSPAAGALADPGTAARARALGLDPAIALAAFDAYPLFAALGDIIVTGPTGNNLRDLRIILSR